MKTIYMDNSATTKVDEQVINEMLPFFNERYANASSLHHKGQEAAQALSKARERCAKLINADPKEIIFTSGGSESDNLAIKQVMHSARKRNEKKNHLITSRIEHPAVLRTCEFLEKEGFNVSYLNVDSEGFVDFNELKNAINENTALVSVMHANNEIGTIQDIERIGNICKENNVLFHTDAVQAVGKVKIDVNEMNIDLLSASSHKLHGPKGVGFLYVKKGINFLPLIHGGGQEFKKRAGTENIPGIVGFGKACQIAFENMEKDNEKIQLLRDKLIEGISNIPKSHLNGPEEKSKRIPNNVHFRFDYIEGEAMLIHLDAFGICGSTGSACSTKSLQPSHVLLALGLKPVDCHGSLRLSLSKYNTEEEVDFVLGKLPGVIEKLRAMSPLNEETIKEFDTEKEKCETHWH